jgi:hypothetical protein
MQSRKKTSQTIAVAGPGMVCLMAVRNSPSPNRRRTAMVTMFLSAPFRCQYRQAESSLKLCKRDGWCQLVLLKCVCQQWQRVPIHWQEDVRFEYLNFHYLGFRSHTSHLPHRSGERREKQMPLKHPLVLMFQTFMSPFVIGIQSHFESPYPVINKF